MHTCLLASTPERQAPKLPDLVEPTRCLYLRVCWLLQRALEFLVFPVLEIPGGLGTPGVSEHIRPSINLSEANSLNKHS